MIIHVSRALTYYILFCKLLEITLYLCRGASGGKQYSNAQTYDYVDNLYSLLEVEDLPMIWPPRYRGSSPVLGLAPPAGHKLKRRIVVG